jgi:Predicted nucleoside-diphosphate-sugar epimerases
MIAVTGASGQLGRHVIKELLDKVAPGEIVCAVRSPQKVADLVQKGVQARLADYDRPETLAAAFAGVEKLLLISANEVGRRVPQHKAVIEAARAAGVGLVAYTSILHADVSPMGLAVEHRETEALLRASGLPHVLLRNSWYTENYTASIPSALKFGAFVGCAGEGRIASAARVDYAAAAAAVLTLPEQAGRVYELAGDEAYTLADLAAETSRQSGREIPYRDLAEAEYKGALLAAGLPEGLAALLSESDTGASKGGLFDGSRQLSGLIGRTTTPLAEMVSRSLSSAQH